MQYIKKIPERLWLALLGSTILTILLTAPVAFAQKATKVPTLKGSDDYPGHQAVNKGGGAALSVMEVIALVGVVVAAGGLGWNLIKEKDKGRGTLLKLLAGSLAGLAIMTHLGGFTQSAVDWIDL